MEIKLKPIAYIRNSRTEKVDDQWNSVQSVIELAKDLPVESLDSIETFSHLEILFFMDKTTKIITGSLHPRENPNWPRVGIFAQRKKDRPNHIGLTTVNLIRKEGRKLYVTNLDAIDGSPVLDIKPVFKEFLPKGPIIQPEWVSELMKNYWT